MIRNALKGFLMSIADAVPGVSGGTIAFILGFYEKLIQAIDNLSRGNKEEKINGLKFLINLGVGWVIGFTIAILFIANLFETEIYKTSSVFIGLMLFSIPIIIIGEINSLKENYKNIIFTIIGIVFGVLISCINPIANVDVSMGSLNIGICIYTFIVAMLAISAMLLPGISGSTLLLIFGLYIPIISALKDLLHFDFSYLPIICVFGLGVLTGAVLIIRFVRWCLEKHRSKTIYAIVGLMIGSIYAIILGPTSLEEAKPALSWETFDIWYCVLGGIIIWALEMLKRYISKKNKKNEVQ